MEKIKIKIRSKYTAFISEKGTYEKELEIDLNDFSYYLSHDKISKRYLHDEIVNYVNYLEY